MWLASPLGECEVRVGKNFNYKTPARPPKLFADPYLRTPSEIPLESRSRKWKAQYWYFSPALPLGPPPSFHFGRAGLKGMPATPENPKWCGVIAWMDFWNYAVNFAPALHHSAVIKARFVHRRHSRRWKARNPKSETRNPKLEARSSKPEARSSKWLYLP